MVTDLGPESRVHGLRTQVTCCALLPIGSGFGFRVQGLGWVQPRTHVNDPKFYGGGSLALVNSLCLSRLPNPGVRLPDPPC